MNKSNDLKKIITVMIIDDDEQDHYLFKHVNKRSNRIDNILCFNSAINALEYLKSDDREIIDVIFLDINMPLMNGFEFLEAATEQLGTEFVDSVIVMLAPSATTVNEERANNFQIVKAILSKPISKEDIDFVVDEIIGRRQDNA